MKSLDPGLSPASSMYFHTASTFAKQTYLYPVCCGHYECCTQYQVDRNNYDSFLLMYVKEGEGCVTLDHKTIHFSKGQAILLDCYHAHAYRAIDNLELIWVHFDGVTARNYFTHIVDASGPVTTLKDPYVFEKNIFRIFDTFAKKRPVNEALYSKYLTDLLTDLIISGNAENSHVGTSNMVDEILSYIHDHLNTFDDSLCLENLAKRVSLSLYYFTRVFKKETGFTPHEYIITARVNAAKFYLKTTSYTMKEICYSCGFPSESSFCTTFRKIMNMTPMQYRKQN